MSSVDIMINTEYLLGLCDVECKLGHCTLCNKIEEFGKSSGPVEPGKGISIVYPVRLGDGDSFLLCSECLDDMIRNHSNEPYGFNRMEKSKGKK